METKRPEAQKFRGTKRPWGKTFVGQNILKGKTSAGTKRPLGQMPMGKNVLGDKRSRGTKYPKTKSPFAIFLMPCLRFLNFILKKNLLSVEGKSTKPIISSTYSWENLRKLHTTVNEVPHTAVDWYHILLFQSHCFIVLSVFLYTVHFCSYVYNIP
jgi:hypothetical protein